MKIHEHLWAWLDSDGGEIEICEVCHKPKEQNPHAKEKEQKEKERTELDQWIREGKMRRGEI